MAEIPSISIFIRDTVQTLESLKQIESDIAAAAGIFVERLLAGSKVLLAGNGGSASQAMHFAGEVIGRFRKNRRPYPAVCLGTDPAASTCILNDYGAEDFFARQVEGLGAPGDVFIGLTTSGKSPNILAALKVARAKGLITIGWLGRDGGPAKELCDHPLIVPGADTARIQEAHLVILHYFAEALERAEG